MEKRKLRIALIGQGFMGRAHSNAYAQVRHFFDLPYEIERKVICGRDAARLQEMAETWGWQETASDWRAVVERKDIDVVDIATPNSLHAPIAVAAASAGKIVMCEKPLAVGVEEAARMTAAVSAVPNMVWFNYRRVPAIALARQLIEQGRLGRIFHYRATYLQQWGNDPSRPPSWKLDKAQAGSGVTGDLLSHLLDLGMWLNGPIRELTAMQQTFADGRSIDDAVLSLVRFANGSVGSFEATRYAVGCRNRNGFEIHGSKAMLHFDLEDLNRLEFLDATDPPEEQGLRNLLVSNQFWKPGHIIGYEHTFIAALADFVQALADGQPFHPDFRDAYRVQLALDAVERSAASGRWEAVTTS